MKELILIGAGGHCHSSIDVINSSSDYKITAIVDLQSNIGKDVLNYKISYTDNDLPNLIRQYKNVLITLGQIKSADKRKYYYEFCKNLGAIFPKIISKTAYVSNYSTINEGTVIHHGAVVNANAKIGVNCIINSLALIEHDVSVGDHCHISTGSILNGNVTVESESFVGSNSALLQGITVKSQSVIAAGSFYRG